MDSTPVATVIVGIPNNVDGFIYVGTDVPAPEPTEVPLNESDLVAAQLTSVMSINSAILIGAFIVFMCLRERIKRVYMTRTLKEYNQSAEEHTADPPLDTLMAPPPAGYFKWMKFVWQYPLDKMLKTHGLDACVVFGFMESVFYIFLVVAVYGLFVLTPVHLSTNNCKTIEEGEPCTPVEGILKLTLANISNGSNLIWFHVVGVYLYSFTTYFFLFRLYKWYASARIKVMRRHVPSNYTVEVSSLPKTTTGGGKFGDQALFGVFDYLFPEEVVAARVTRRFPKTDKLRAKRLDAVRSLERAAAAIGVDPFGKKIGDYKEPKNKERPTVKIDKKLKCFGGEEVDAIKHWRSEINRLGEEIRKSLMTERKQVTDTGFVTFTTISRAYQVQQILLERRTFRMKMSSAPTPRDVIWKNIQIPPKQSKGRTLAVTIFVLLMVFFWASPVAIVTQIVNLAALARLLRTVGAVTVGDWIDDLPVSIAGPISAYTPLIVIAILLSIVPLMLEFLSTWEGTRTHSGVDRSVMKRYYLFIVVNVFLVITLAGAMAQVLSFFQRIVEQPSLVPELLGKAVPQQAFFFCFYIAQAAMGTMALSLLRAPTLILGFLKAKFLAKCARDRLEAYGPEPYKVGSQMARHLLMFTIGLTFSIALPLVLLFSCLYWGVGSLFTKYNLLYVHIGQYEGHGKLFNALFVRAYAGLVLFQVACIGMFGSKSAAIQAPFILLLLPITYYMFTWTTGTFRAPSKHLNLMESKDLEDGHSGEQFHGSYISPSMYEDEVVAKILKDLKGTEVDPKAEDPYKKAYASALRRAVPTTFKQKQNLYDDGYEDDEDADDAGEDVYGLGVDDDVATNPRRSSDTPKPRARDDDEDDPRSGIELVENVLEDSTKPVAKSGTRRATLSEVEVEQADLESIDDDNDDGDENDGKSKQN